jgi:hypothetical protein
LSKFKNTEVGPSVTKKIVLLLAAIALAAIGLYSVARGIAAGSIMLDVGGGGALIVGVICLFFAAVGPSTDRE